MNRPSWDQWSLSLAEAVATRADCTRAQVGAVLLSRDHRVLSVGFNGLPAGIPGCASAGNCPRGRHYLTGNTLMFGEELCACGELWPCPAASSPDSDYSNCPAIHAEANAIYHADPKELPHSTLYVTREPCPACRTLINSAGIARVVVGA